MASKIQAQNTEKIEWTLEDLLNQPRIFKRVVWKLFVESGKESLCQLRLTSRFFRQKLELYETKGIIYKSFAKHLREPNFFDQYEHFKSLPVNQLRTIYKCQDPIRKSYLKMPAKTPGYEADFGTLTNTKNFETRYLNLTVKESPLIKFELKKAVDATFPHYCQRKIRNQYSNPRNYTEIAIIGDKQNGSPLIAIYGDFSQFRSIKKMSLRYCPNIITLPETLSSLADLESLYIKFAQGGARTFPADIHNFTNLKTLDLSGNNLEILPPEVYKLTNLRELLLRYNKISKLDEEIGNLIKLERIYLNQNQLRSLPKSIEKLTKLETLEVSSYPNTFNNLEEGKYYKLETFPAEILNLTQLKCLDLSYNNMTQIPEKINQLKSLIRLTIGYNPIKELPDTINDLQSLIELIIPYNLIEKLPDMATLVNLTVLCAANNQLKQIPASIASMTSLKKILISNNNLTTLPEGLGDQAELTELDIKGNPSLRDIRNLPESIRRMEINYPTQILRMDYLGMD